MVVRMSEMGQVPGARSGHQPRGTEDGAASTQMFRAFVEQGGEPGADGRSRTGLIVAAGGLLLAALAVIVVLFLV